MQYSKTQRQKYLGLHTLYLAVFLIVAWVAVTLLFSASVYAQSSWPSPPRNENPDHTVDFSIPDDSSDVRDIVLTPGEGDNWGEGTLGCTGGGGDDRRYTFDSEQSELNNDSGRDVLIYSWTDDPALIGGLCETRYIQIDLQEASGNRGYNGWHYRGDGSQSGDFFVSVDSPQREFGRLIDEFYDESDPDDTGECRYHYETREPPEPVMYPSAGSPNEGIDSNNHLALIESGPGGNETAHWFLGFRGQDDQAIFGSTDGDVNFRVENPHTAEGLRFMSNGECAREDTTPVAENWLENTDDAGVPLESSENEDNIECDAGFGFSWLICGAISLFQDFMDFAKDILSTLLSVSPLERTTQNENGETVETTIYTTWSAVRNIANVLLIPVFLFLIFAQASSFKMDTYTVKKMIPRLVAAAILIQASFFVVAIAVDITNVLGRGVESLILAPVQDATLDFTGAAETGTIAGGIGLLGIFATVGGLSTIAGGAIAIFLALLPVIIGIVATFFTLILRLIIIVLLAVLSPIAFLLWILPNTEKWFKQWLDMLTKALLMFPLIMVLLASGTLVAVIATNFADEGVESAVGALIGFVAIMAPLFIVPFTYKMAGTAVSVIGNTVSSLTNKAAAGKDGKGGLTKGLRERKEQRDTDVGAGMAPENWAGRAIMKTPYARRAASAGARPGLGVGRKSQAQAVGKFNQQIGESEKTLDAENINDQELLNEFAQNGGTRGALNGRIRKLNDEGKTDTAEKLKGMTHHAGKNEMQAAALKRVAEQGKADDQSFEDVQKAFGDNKQVQSQVLSDAANAAGKGGRPDQKARYMGKPMSEAIRGQSIEDWNKTKDDAFKDADFAEAVQGLENDEQGRATLRSLLGPQSGLSPNMRQKIQDTVNEPYRDGNDNQKRDRVGEIMQTSSQNVNVAATGGQPIENVDRQDTQGGIPVNPRSAQGGESSPQGGSSTPPSQPPTQQNGPTLPNEHQRSSGLYVPGENERGGGVPPEAPSDNSQNNDTGSNDT